MRNLSSNYLKYFIFINNLFIFNNLYKLDILNNLTNIYFWIQKSEGFNGRI